MPYYKEHEVRDILGVSQEWVEGILPELRRPWDCRMKPNRVTGERELTFTSRGLERLRTHLRVEEMIPEEAEDEAVAEAVEEPEPEEELPSFEPVKDADGSVLARVVRLPHNDRLVLCDVGEEQLARVAVPLRYKDVMRKLGINIKIRRDDGDVWSLVPRQYGLPWK